MFGCKKTISKSIIGVYVLVSIVLVTLIYHFKSVSYRDYVNDLGWSSLAALADGLEGQMIPLDEALHEQRVHFRDTTARQWQVDIDRERGSEDRDLVDKANLEALTRQEWRDHAALGNGDACIALALNCHCTSIYGEFALRKYWLGQASRLKRPGADFLLELVLWQERQLPELPFSCSDLTKLKHYGAFISQVETGDLYLWNALINLLPSASNLPVKQQIPGALEELARRGDKAAARDLCLWRLLYEDFEFEPDFKALVLESDPMPLSVVMRAAPLVSPTWRERHRAARQLRRAAKSGDQGAMQYWLHFGGVVYHQPFSPDVWRDIFEMSDVLIRNGHAGFMEHLLFNHRQFTPPGYFWLPYDILAYAYTSDSQQRVYSKITDDLRRRGSLMVLSRDIVDCDADANAYYYRPATAPEAIARMIDINPAYLIKKSVYQMIIEHESRPEVTALLEQAITGLADQGWPEAKLALADLIAQGRIKGKTETDSRHLLESAWRDLPRYNSTLPDASSPFGRATTSLAAAAASHLMTLYLSEGGHAYNPRQAARLAQSYYRMKSERHMGVNEASRYYMGLIHEHGYGVDADMAKAARYYREGCDRREVKSKLALGRLYEEGKGVVQDGGKARELYRQADAARRVYANPEEIDQALERINEHY